LYVTPQRQEKRDVHEISTALRRKVTRRTELIIRTRVWNPFYRNESVATAPDPGLMYMHYTSNETSVWRCYFK